MLLWRPWPCTCGRGPPRTLTCTYAGSRGAAATLAMRRRTSGRNGGLTGASKLLAGDGHALLTIGERKSTDNE
eukprot:1739407-Pyramimonas_sp.AAC.1